MKANFSRIWPDSDAPSHSIGVALCRIAIAISSLSFFVGNFAHRYVLWGRTSIPGGLIGDGFPIPISTFSHPAIDAAVVISVAVSVALAIRGGRILTILQAILMWSFHSANGAILDGGDNFAQIVILFLILTRNDRYFAFGARERRGQRGVVGLDALSHNLGTRLIVFQTLVVYAVAGLWKLSSPMWRSGTALYYVSQLNEFAFAGGTMKMLFGTPWIAFGFAWMTILTQVGVVALAASKRRHLTMLAVCVMHLGIMTGLGLVPFGLAMLGGDAMLLTDADYRRMRATIGAPLRRLQPRLSRSRRSVRLTELA